MATEEHFVFRLQTARIHTRMAIDRMTRLIDASEADPVSVRTYLDRVAALAGIRATLEISIADIDAALIRLAADLEPS